MRASGIVRRIDRLGRITLPKELRNKLGIDVQDWLGFYVECDSIILAPKDKAACIFCGGDKNLAQYSDKNICGECLINLCGAGFRGEAI